MTHIGQQDIKAGTAEVSEQATERGERVAAIDIAKASGMVCVRTPPNSSLACAHHRGRTGVCPSLRCGQVAIHDHRHLA
ncbi:hypothetical protein GCM10009753_27850 [Streptantibioticus ferralitis]